MTLNDLAMVVNESTAIKLFRYVTFDEYGSYDGIGEVPYKLGGCEVTDIFTDGNVLCIELDFGDKGEDE